MRQAETGTAPRRALPRLAGERGYTLVEMLVAMVLGIVVVGGPIALIIVSLSQQNATSSRTVAARQAEVGLERLTRDLRQAQNLPDPTTGVNATPVTVTYGSGSSTATLNVDPNGAASGAVVWTRSAAGACTRKQGSAAAVPLINGVTSATFTPLARDGTTLTSGSTDPAFLNIQIKVQVTSQLDAGQTHAVSGVNHPITVQDGVALRNYS